MVALRKESVDRNITALVVRLMYNLSLSARRAWIEITGTIGKSNRAIRSLSARRAWIEIPAKMNVSAKILKVALRKESVDRNVIW